jgi:hypothetical protein
MLNNAPAPWSQAVSAQLWRDIGILCRECLHRGAIMAGMHALS